MGYRNIKPKIIHINDLLNKCGLFDPETELNGGYGCLSKSKEKSEPGKCYAFDCPIAWEADLEDFKKYDQDLYEQYKDDQYDPSEQGANWVIQYREIL